MSGYFVLGEDGRTPVPVSDSITWAKAFQNGDKRRVASDKVGSVTVSTVFLGLDHSFSDEPDHAPILFETLVFEGPLDGEMERYATWAEAEVGHAEMLRRVREADGVAASAGEGTNANSVLPENAVPEGQTPKDSGAVRADAERVA